MTKENPEKCEVCGSEFLGSWTDFFGEKTCWTCGAPYQILAPSGANPDATYPHLNLSEEFIPVLREYWEKTKRRARVGRYVRAQDYPGLVEERKEFVEWLRENHPEFAPKKRSGPARGERDA